MTRKQPEPSALPPPGRMRSLSYVEEYLGISMSTVRRLIDRGQLRAHRVGRGLRVHDTDLAAFIATSMNLQK